jgi:1-acyl-sn-glycerol-3-phosphate acyltransferase
MIYDTRASPFLVLDAPFTLWEAAKFALLLPLLPLKLAVILAAALAVGVANAAAVGACDLALPLPRWRRLAVAASSRLCTRVILAAAGFYCPRVRGREHLRRGLDREGAVVVANHVSYADAFAVVAAFCPCGITLEFTKTIPLLGPGIRALQNIYVSSDGASEQGGAARAVAERAERSAEYGVPVIVFPEGTLSDGRGLLRFKTGAFAAGRPVVPLVLRYPPARLPLPSFARALLRRALGDARAAALSDASFSPAWGIVPMPFHLLRMLTQLYNPLELEFLPVYKPTSAERNNPALYAQNVRMRMARALAPAPGGVDGGKGGRLYDKDDRTTMMALERAGVRTTWDGRRVEIDARVATADPAALGPDGRIDLGPHLAAIAAEAEAKRARRALHAAGAAAMASVAASKDGGGGAAGAGGGTAAEGADGGGGSGGSSKKVA